MRKLQADYRSFLSLKLKVFFFFFLATMDIFFFFFGLFFVGSKTSKPHHCSNISINFRFFLCSLLLLSNKTKVTTVIKTTRVDIPRLSLCTHLFLFLFLFALSLSFLLFLLLFQDSLIEIYNNKRKLRVMNTRFLSCLCITEEVNGWYELNMLLKDE